MGRRKAVWGARIILALFVFSGSAAAQETPLDPARGEQAPPPDQPTQVSDRAVNVSQPDFTLVSLPTTLRMPRNKWYFRVTHRFTRPLGEGDFDDLLADFFGFDSAGIIGLELRYGIWDGVQVGIHRTSNRTIQFFGQGNVLRQGDGSPVGIDAVATAEGLDNFSENYGAAFGAVISRELNRRGAVYVEPIFVVNAAELAREPLPVDDHTFMIGLGARVRLWTTGWYVVGEWAPRVAGYDAGTDHGSLAIEGRAGGHSFQINFSTSFATTYGQLARGGFGGSDDWFIGFNITRKFF
jgi:Membrane bound beta barrel domain (DUF5777)